MKKTKTVRGRNSKVNPLGIAVVLFVLLLIITVYNIGSKRSTRHVSPAYSAGNIEGVAVESYVRSLVTTNVVLEGFRPAIIYYKRPDMLKEEYCCVGSLFYTPKTGPRIISSGHVFRHDIPTTQVLSVRALNGTMDPEVVYINQIIFSGEGSSNSSDTKLDIFVATLSTTPVVLQPYSNFTDGELNTNYWGEVSVGNKKITTVRSILSGEVVNTLGYTKYEGGRHIIVNRTSRRGESGTGFVDEYGGIWVLHAGPENQAANLLIREEGRQLTGKNIVGVTALSGPVFGKYD